MKALTLWQPYATLVMDRRKRVETRPRAWYYIGQVAIHAGLHIDTDAAVKFGYDPAKLPTGAVLGVAYKNGCTQFPNMHVLPDPFGNFDAGRYGYPFGQIQKFKTPIPAQGHQGYWNWHSSWDVKENELTWVDKQVTAVCDRCGHDTGSPLPDGSMTAGYYYITRPDGWGLFANPGEHFICDVCMWSDPRYIKVYGTHPSGVPRGPQ